MSLFDIVREIDNKENAVVFLQRKGVIREVRNCQNGHEMKLYLTETNDRWRSNRKYCRHEVGLRKGTWLENSKLSYDTVIFFIYSWCKEYTTTKYCAEELNMSMQAITDWKNYLREVCADSLLKNPIKIGGPNKTVEIDESCFSRRKYNVGRLYPQQWVFGGICREDRQCFLYAVPDRSADTLSSVIRDCIKPGSTIMSDQWAAYRGIEEMAGLNFTHLTIIHEISSIQ